jgi:hypothetical protein
MTFDSSIVELSAQQYRADLMSVTDDPCSPQLKAAATALIGLLDAALADREKVSLQHVPELHSMLRQVPMNERHRLINQASLGLGTQDARLLIVGQEHAYDLEQTQSLALEGCGLTTLWLCGGRPDIAARLSGLRLSRPFTIYPNDYYPDRPAGHTWNYVADLVGVARGGDFGEHAHLIEISAHPATQQDGGMEPRRDPRIALVIGWDEEQTVQLEGIADEPHAADLERLKKVYFEVFPDGIERQEWKDITYVRVRPTWARYSDFRPGGSIVELADEWSS